MNSLLSLMKKELCELVFLGNWVEAGSPTEAIFSYLPLCIYFSASLESLAVSGSLNQPLSPQEFVQNWHSVNIWALMSPQFNIYREQIACPNFSIHRVSVGK